MDFRDYDNCNDNVENLYKNMYMDQSYNKKVQLSNDLKYEKQLLIRDAIVFLNKVKDSSDPDTTHEQIYHGYQTAESMRNNYFENESFKNVNIIDLFSDKEWEQLPKKYKLEYNTTIKDYYNKIDDWNWLILIGLIHDLGKVLVLPDFGGYPEHFSVGDIYPLGCKFQESNIYYEKKYHIYSCDYNNIDYNTLNGIYKENCGFNNVEMTFSHDFYLYQILNRSSTNLPAEALYIIRYHSFYSWHTPRNGVRAYTNLANETDWKNLPLLKLFQKNDLYSKTEDLPNILGLEPYYNNLICKYITDVLWF